MRKINKKGVTLMEILAVIAIVSILFTLLIPSVTKGFDKAKELSIKKDLKTYSDAITMLFIDEFYGDLTEEQINENLDSELMFETNVSKKENPYNINYNLKIKSNRSISVQTSNDRKDADYFDLDVLYINGEVKVKFYGFDKRLSLDELTAKDEGVIDEDGDGVVDSWDKDGDGLADEWDKNNDGIPDSWDKDGDGVADSWDSSDFTLSSNSESYEKSKTITISEKTGSLKTKSKEYTWSSNERTPSSGWKTLDTSAISKSGETGDFYFHIKWVDEIGNIYYKNKLVKVDNTSPSITLSKTGSTSYQTKYTTTVKVTDVHAGVSNIEYVWSKNTSKPLDGWQATSSDATIETPEGASGIYYLYVYATDALGNRSDVKSNAFYIDSQKPSISVSLNGNAAHAKSYETTVTATDADSGIKEIEYIWSTSATAPTSETWTKILSNTKITTPIGKTGSYYLHIKTTDYLGFTETFKSNVFAIDNTNPSLSLSVTSGSTYSNSYSSTITSADSNAGISKIEYVWSTATSAPSSGWTTTTTGSSISSGSLTGIYYLYARSTDKAGNAANVKSSAFYLDNTKPTVSLSINGGSTYAKSYSTTVTSADSNAGISKIEYVWSTATSAPSSGWTTTTTGSSLSSGALTGDYYLYIRSTDKAGNINNFKSSVFKIDNTKPTVSLSTNGSSTYIKTASPKVTASDSHAGIKSVTYQWTTSSTFPTSGTWSSTSTESTLSKSSVTGSYYLHIKVVDKINQETQFTSSVFKLDFTSPIVSLSKDGNSQIASSEKISITTTDTHSGVNTVKYQWTNNSTFPNEGTWKTYTSGEIQTPNLSANTFDNYFLHVNAVDKVGNNTDFTSGAYLLSNVSNTSSVCHSNPNPATDFKYTISSSNVTITDYIGDSKDVIIPCKIEGYQVTVLGTESFQAKQLKSVILPNGLLTISLETFYKNKIKSIIIPDSVTFLGSYSLDSNSLEYLYIGKNLKTLVANPILRNGDVVVRVSEENQYFKHDIIDDALYSKDGKKLYYGTKKTYSNPNYDNVEILGSSSFFKTGLTELKYPANIKIIENEVFSNNNIKEAWLPSNITTVPGRLFRDNNQLTKVTLHNNITSIGREAFYSNSLTNVTIPDSVTSIEYSAFHSNKLTSVTLSNNLKTIGYLAFYNNKLTNVTIPDSVTSLDYGAFSVNSLTSVKLSSGLTTLGFNPFYGTQDPTFTLSSSNTNFKLIGSGKAIMTADGSRLITGHENVIGTTEFANLSKIDKSAFYYKDLSGTLTLPSKITEINENTFAYSKLEGISIPNSVTTINDYAFQGSSLKSVTIPNSVTSIGAYAFSSNQLTSLTIPNSVTSIGDYAFNNNLLTNVTLPSTLKSQVESRTNVFVNKNGDKITFTYK